MYRLWLAMRNRCNNQRTNDYKYYGGRGIKVCPDWDDYDRFASDVGPHPGVGWTLDHIDNNDHYRVGNVRWATRKTQARNRNYCILNMAKATAIHIEYDTTRITQKQLGVKYGVSQLMISRIVTGKSWL
jgi:hypothetical protein